MDADYDDADAVKHCKRSFRYLAIIFKFKSTASIEQIRCSWRRLAKIIPPAVNEKSKFFEQARCMWVLHSDETSLDLPMLSQLILVKCHCGLFWDEH